MPAAPPSAWDDDAYDVAATACAATMPQSRPAMEAVLRRGRTCIAISGDPDPERGVSVQELVADLLSPGRSWPDAHGAAFSADAMAAVWLDQLDVFEEHVVALLERACDGSTDLSAQLADLGIGPACTKHVRLAAHAHRMLCAAAWCSPAACPVGSAALRLAALLHGRARAAGASSMSDVERMEQWLCLVGAHSMRPLARALTELDAVASAAAPSRALWACTASLRRRACGRADASWLLPRQGVFDSVRAALSAVTGAADAQPEMPMDIDDVRADVAATGIELRSLAQLRSLSRPPSPSGSG